MDEKFERVGSLKMCVWRKIENCRRRKKIKVRRKADKRRRRKWIFVKKWVDEKKRGKTKIKKRKENKGSYVGGCWVRV